MPDQVTIEVKSRWRPKGSGPNGHVCRVMGIVEGWVMARYKGASPFLLHQNDWPKKFEVMP